jgi:hypothetical protein
MPPLASFTDWPEAFQNDVVVDILVKGARTKAWIDAARQVTQVPAQHVPTSRSRKQIGEPRLIEPSRLLCSLKVVPLAHACRTGGPVRR